MGCNLSKTKKKEDKKKKDTSQPGETVVSEVSRPAAETLRNDEAHTSQTAHDGASATPTGGSQARQAAEGEVNQQPDTGTDSEETTYDNLQSESERICPAEENKSDGASTEAGRGPAKGGEAPAETAEAEERREEREVKVGAGAAEGNHPSATASIKSDKPVSARSAPVSPHPNEERESEKPGTPASEGAEEAAAAQHNADTTTQSEVDFQILSEEPVTHDEALTFHTEPQAPVAEEKEGKAQPTETAARTSESTSTPRFEMVEEEEEEVLPAQLPPPPAASTSDAEAISPVAKDRAPEPTPMPFNDQRPPSSAGHSRTGAPFLHTAAREEQRRQSRAGSSISEPPLRRVMDGAAGTAAASTKRCGQRKMSTGSSPAKRKAMPERPPWVDIVTPPVESFVEEEEDQQRPQNVYVQESNDNSHAVAHSGPPSPKAPAAAPAAVVYRRVEQIDAEARTPSVHHSDWLASEQPSDHVSQEQSASRSAFRATPPLDRPEHPQTRYVHQQQHSAAPSEASVQEPVISPVAMPINTPKERVAARHRRSGAAAAEVIHLHQPQQFQQQQKSNVATSMDGMSGSRTPRPQRTTQTPAPVPPQHLQQLSQVPAAPPIPYRTAYTDPSPVAAGAQTSPQQQQRHAPTTQMPPPTAYYVDEAGRGPRRFSLDPAAMVAIEASTHTLVHAHIPVSTDSNAHNKLPNNNRYPSVVSQGLLPPSTVDSAVYRDPCKLPPSHLIDPVYGPTSTNPRPPSSHDERQSPYNERVPSNSPVAAGCSKGNSSVPGSVAQSSSSGYRRSAQNGAGPAGALRNGGRSNASSRSGQSGAIQGSYTAAKAPPGSGDYGSHCYGDEIDEVSGHASSFHHPVYAVSSNSRGGFEPLYSNPQEPWERSVLPYEPSVTEDVPANAAVLRPSGNAAGAAAICASHSSKQSSLMQSNASWSPAEGLSLHGNDFNDAEHEVRYAEEEAADNVDDEGAAYQYSSNGSEHEVEYCDSANPTYHEEEEMDEEGEVNSQQQQQHQRDVVLLEETTTATTVVATMPDNEGHVVERLEPEWQLLQHAPEENKSLYQQAKFVAQMRNVTGI